MAKDVNANILHIADYYQKKYNTSDIFKQCFVGQMVHESGNGTSALAVQDMNYGGLGAIEGQAHDPDEPRWAKFSSLEEEADYVYKVFYSHYPEIHQVKTAKEFMDILWNNQYVVAEGSENPTEVYNAYLQALTEYTGETFNPTNPPAGSAADAKGGVMSKTSASDTGVQSTVAGKKKTPKTYTIYNMQKLAKGKTYCAPVYPDIISVYNQVPEWALGSNLKANTQEDTSVKDATEVKDITFKDKNNKEHNFGNLTKNKQFKASEGFTITDTTKTEEEKPKEEAAQKASQDKKVQKTAIGDGGLVTITTDSKPESKDDKTKTDSTKTDDTKEEAQREEKTQGIPLYAYETRDNEKGCFDVGLPLSSIAAYGSEAAKYQMTRMQSIAQRQIQFDPTKHDNAVKVPTPGMVPNNKDAFPVDLRIRDLEYHQPRIVRETIKATEFEEQTAKALLAMGGNVEKRMVQVENHLSTVTRYLFRLGSIVPINDMYYGGNSTFEKYKSVRQLTDDRVTDGMQTQIDQYMTSTRLEPIIGQTYEILNQVGANLSVILDDNQLSYSNMKHYCDLIDIKRYQEPLKLASINEGASLTKSGDQSEQELNSVWPEGFKMDWKLVPVEEQVPIINWRQSIIDDGSDLMNSAGMYGNGNAMGSALTGTINNIFYKTAVELEGTSLKQFKDVVDKAKQSIKGYEDQAKNIAKSKDTYMTMKKKIEGAQLHKDFSGPVIASIMCITNTSNSDGIISKLQSLTKELKDNSLIDNPLLVALSYFSDKANVIGDKPTKDATEKKKEHEDLKTRLDYVYKLVSNSGSNNGGGESKQYFNLDIKNQGAWTFTQFWEPYSINDSKNRKDPVSPSNKLNKLIELCIVFKEISKSFYESEFDNDQWGFFWKAEYIPSMKLTGMPGEQRSGHVHQGMDIVFEPDSPKPEILSICDGTVVDTGWGLNAVMVNAANGTNRTIVYMHMSQLFVKPGDTIQRGQPIGIIGGMGENGPNTYDEHLHIEVWSEPNRGGSYGSIGDLYPGIFQDYCAAYMKMGKGSELRYADFTNKTY
jgi:membrane proteins related to metalloendopeptidases|nr:MAG TPA: peptidase [Caudoviricetes sp.]